MADLDPPDFRLLPDDDEFDADNFVESESGRSLGLRGKVIAGVLVGALAASGVLVQLRRAERHESPPVATSSTQRSWPSGRDICNNKINQPVIQANPPSGRTGIELSIGGISLMFGNLDTGQTNPQIMLIGDTFLFDRVQSGNTTFVELADCSAGNRIEQVNAAGQYRTVLDDPLSNGLLTDGEGGVWAARFTDGGATMSEAKLQVILRRLDRPSEIALGSLMFPLAMRGHLLYAEQQVSLGTGSRLVVFDLDRRRVVQDLGPFDSAEAADRVLVWVPRRCTGIAACQVDSLDLATGVQHVVSSSLPPGFRVNGAAISPDHRMLAAQANHSEPDPNYPSPDGGLPSGVTLIDLFAGAVYPVPHVEIPPTGHVGLAFATDSTRLVLAAGSGLSTDFYVWTPGHPWPDATALTVPGPLPSPMYLRAVHAG